MHQDEALDRKLIALLGATPRGAIEFAPSIATAEPQVAGLLHLIRFLAEQLDFSEVRIPPLVVRELEQAIIVQFLIANDYRYRRTIEREASHTTPAMVRLAEEFIEARWNHLSRSRC